MAMAILLVCFLLGCVAGLRSFASPAVVCWAAHLGWLKLAGSKLAFLGHPIALTIFTLLALGELVADKLPKTPSRLAAPGLLARILFGGLAGVAVGLSAGGSTPIAAVAGAAGAMVGAFAGYHIRRALVREANLPPLGVALCEDLIAIGTGLLLVSRPV